MTDTRNGQIITFYSYKGGTGRTMALANTAWILAANGHRVLVVDWDLESPGLHRFYRPFIHEGMLRGAGGVIDMLVGYEGAAKEAAGRDPAGPGELRHASFADVRRHAFSINWRWPPGGHSTSSARAATTTATAGRSPDSTGTTSTRCWPVARSSTRSGRT
ncbi:hypothetical protein GCM10029963_04280 [Micromonospora andamanensis]